MDITVKILHKYFGANVNIFLLTCKQKTWGKIMDTIKCLHFKKKFAKIITVVNFTNDFG